MDLSAWAEEKGMVSLVVSYIDSPSQSVTANFPLCYSWNFRAGQVPRNVRASECPYPAKTDHRGAVITKGRLKTLNL